MGAIGRFASRRKHPAALTTIVALVIISLIGPFLVPYSPSKVNVEKTLEAPSGEHLLGTDELGRDVVARALRGIRLSVGIGVLGMGVATMIGVVIGAVAGYFRGRIDALLMRLVDVLLSVPTIILILVIASIHGPSGWIVIWTMMIAGWCWTARITRGEFLRLRRAGFVEAALSVGASNTRIMFRHILLNGLSPIIVDTTQGVGGTILLESAVSYLGFGVQPPQASLGSMLFQAQTYLLVAPWIAIVPGFLIFIIVLSFLILGDGLRDALDPTFLAKPKH